MLREVDSKSTEQEKRAVRERYAALDQQRNDELDALCARDPQRCRAIAISLANDDQKLVDLVGKLRSQGQGGAASAVGFVIGSNLDASSKIAADISSAGGGVLVKLGAEAIKAGVGVTLPSRSGAGKGKGSQGEAAGPDVPQGAKEIGAHAKVDYSSIENPPNVGPGKEFTLRQKQEALELNKAANDGVVKSDASGTVLVKPQKSQRGVTPDPNEWQFDHVKPKNCDGTNCSSNLQILSRQENRAKSDK